MNGLLTIEGLLAADWDEAAVAELAPLRALHPNATLNGGCTLTNHTSFLAWHGSRWWGKISPIDFRSAMASSFLQSDAPRGAGTAVAATISERVVAMPSTELTQMFFGIQLGGAVSRIGGHGESAVSPAFRGAALLQEAVAQWVDPLVDAQQMNWSSSTGDRIAGIKGLKGSYLNEPDSTLADGVYESRFWGSNYPRLQQVKRAVDPAGFFECVQCVRLPGA